MLYPPYVCASCAQLIDSPVFINSTPLHAGCCAENYRSGGPLYHPDYLAQVRTASVFGLPLRITPETPAVPDPLACDGCGCLSNECSPCPACQTNLCLGCQDFHRGHLHVNS